MKVSLIRPLIPNSMTCLLVDLLIYKYLTCMTAEVYFNRFKNFKGFAYSFTKLIDCDHK